MRDLHASQIKAAVEAVKARKEVNEVYFVACGGSRQCLWLDSICSIRRVRSFPRIHRERVRI